MRGCFAIGQTNYCHLEEKKILAVNSYFAGRPVLTSESNVAKFYRAEVNGILLCSEHYERIAVRNSFTVLFKQNGTEEFGTIRFFSIVFSTVLAFVQVFTENKECLPSDNVISQWIIPVTKSSTIKCISLDCIVSKCVYVRAESGIFFCKLASNICD